MQTCATVYPPRPEDPTGILVPGQVEREANRRLRLMLEGTRETPQERAWWLDGFVVGFSEQTVAALDRAGEATGMPADSELVRMGRTVLASGRLTPVMSQACERVFPIMAAVAHSDQLEMDWALHGLWVCPPPVSRERLQDHVRAVISAAVMACCAAWRIEIGVTRGL